MTILQDENQRLKALNPNKSFIVQAPAGSGKTELLIQRFLVLLSSVKQPEEILSITFTKKSAAEMRVRIINALQNAQDNPEPLSPHAKKTWQLARKVLQQDQLLKWHLLANPNRLRLQTIDSFNASLTRQLPLLSHFGAPPEITNDPHFLYQKAVQEFLSHLEEEVSWSNAIATILLHMDNDLNKVEALLIHLLSKRDQWLRHITLNANDEFLREKLETQLKLVVTDILAKLKDNFPKSFEAELMQLLQYAANNVSSDSVIACCIHLESLPDTSVDDIPYWLAIREMLFTKSDEWRKKFEKDIGFLPASHFKSAEDKNHAAFMKLRMTELIGKLSENSLLKNCFKELHHAPDIYYKETQWNTLEALHFALRIVSAQLKIVFQQHGKIDYIENSLGALTALGTEEFPTDLTLALDYQIKHILVDEFQDTSNSQYDLLKKITAGWTPNDGRTLFLVGDPMQSIYRFREAEVGLFIRTRKYGIGHIKLESLILSVNFRSTPDIVNWINEHFPNVLPAFDDMSTGAVSYSPSLANQDKLNDNSTVSINALMDSNKEAQADAIVSLIQKRKSLDPLGTIAILVRSRTHLEEIIPALKKSGIAYRAIDIDPLTLRPFIQDLMGLTRAMLHLADRIAWLTILRAPWCGLSLSDLLYLSGQDSKITLWERIQSNHIEQLSPEGQIRLKRFLSVMKIKIAERERYSLRAWIESTWLLLGGPACLNQQSDLDDTTAYFKLLSTLEQNGTFNPALLADYVNQLYATPDNKADETLQIMTIHNAKGLEFDSVILPHLECKSSNDDKQLLLWMERTRPDESHSLILAPVHAIGHDTDSIYEYIKKENAIKNDYERSRLLYVAVTRAKKHLDLFFTLKSDKKIHSSSLLDKLWPSIQNKISILNNSENTLTVETNLKYTPLILKRLAVAWQNPVNENRPGDTISYHQQKFGFLLPDHTPKQIGTIVHQVLQQICQFGFQWWEAEPNHKKSAYLKMHLLRLGIHKEQLTASINNVSQLIDNTLQDPRGRWILQKHKESQAEFRLTALINSVSKQFIIDRTFVDENNIRWIIDYKTTAQPSEKDDLLTFLQEEEKKYQQPMWHYFQAIREIDHRPIRMGLYFPAIPAWHEWEFEKEKQYENLAN